MTLPLYTPSLLIRPFVAGDAARIFALSREESLQRRRGLATEAIAAASAWALAQFRLSGILGIAASGNAPSRRSLARAGFVHEGDRTLLFQGSEQPVSLYRLTEAGGRAAGELG